MKKVALLGLVLILLAASVVPVMAAGNGSNGNGNGNGHGNGVSAGQTDNRGNGDQTRDRDQIRLSKPNKSPNRGASGAQNSMRMRTPFYLQGTITDITGTDPMTVTVSLTHGNAQVKQFISDTLDLQATSTTTMIFRIIQGGEDTESTEGNTSTNDDEGPSNRVKIYLSDLKIGQQVAIHGNVVDGQYKARLITVYIRSGDTVETP